MHQLWLIPILPFAGFLINGIFGRRLSKPVVNATAIGSVLLAFLWVVNTLLQLGSLDQPYVERYFSWIASGTLNIGFDFAVDRLSAVMLLVVTGIGTLIHIYSIGYMSHEGGYYRFFAYMNLFMFFMLTLVLGANYLVLFVGWEGVGLCSYLLIGFYFLKKSATNAGMKAFVVNRIGDFGFTLAMFLIVAQFGSLDFQQVFAKAAGLSPEKGAGMLTLICLLLMVGATGKSAQVPLYVWLPDAMEGPTPVSALIHAATMVTAGVYMVARSATLFTRAPIAMDVVAYIGLVTAVLAATIGLVQNDIKKSIRLLDGLATWLYVPRLRLRSVFRRHLPPDDACLLQGFVVPRRWQRDPRALRRTGPAQDGRFADQDSGDVSPCCSALRSPLPACRRSRASTVKTRFWLRPTPTRRGCTGPVSSPRE